MIVLGYFLQAAVSTAAYGVIFYAWWRLAERWKQAEAGESLHLLLALTLMWGQIFGVVFALGLLHVLYPSLVLAANGGITLVLLIVARKRAGPAPGLYAILRRSIRELFAEKAGRQLLVGLTALFAAAMLWFTAMNIILPAGGYDDYVFHIPSAAIYLQQHSLSLASVAPVQEAINTAAKLGELFSVFQFSLLGSDRLIHFWMIPILLQYVLSVYALCRQLGVDRSNALFGTILSAFCPTLLCQTLTSYNDAPTAVLFATALAFACARRRSAGQRVATALSCGLLLSSKLSAVMFCAVCFACFVAVELRESGRGWLTALKNVIAIGICSVLIGGYWYARNFAEYRNPFYPFDARIAGIHFPGPISNHAEVRLLNRELADLPLPVRLWRVWREERSHSGLWLYNYDAFYSGFGAIFFILGIPSFLAAFAISILDGRWAGAVLFLLTGLAYLGFSGNSSARLSLFVMPAAGLGMAVVLAAIDRDWPWNRLPGLGYGVKGVGCALACFTFLVAAMSPIAPQVVRTQLWSAPQDKDSLDGTFLNLFAPVRKAIPASAVVGYAEGTTFLWPLWRPDWSNQVRFVTTAGGWEQWRGEAAKLHVTHVVAPRPEPTTLNSWIEQYPDRFKRLAQDRFGAFYEYRP